jgi:predicted metal-dependent hydrolase
MSLVRAIEQFNRGEFFECHETIEDIWVEEIGPRKQFLQGILHVAVGLLHLERGNLSGSLSQFGKALSKLDPYRPGREGIDLEQLLPAVEGARQYVLELSSGRTPPPLSPIRIQLGVP